MVRARGRGACGARRRRGDFAHAQALDMRRVSSSLVAGAWIGRWRVRFITLWVALCNARCTVWGMGQLRTVDERIQQQQRRIYERRGVFIAGARLRAGYFPDLLETRAMWRRSGRKLVVSAMRVGGKVERFLSP
jgi:hypothetical protein